MKPELMALIAHDLKNALAVLEGELFTLEQTPTKEGAAAAHLHASALRQRLVGFLTVYKDEGLAVALEDTEPLQFLRSTVQAAKLPAEPELTLRLAPHETAPPSVWYMDTALVRMALDAAIQNATRFARRDISLSARQEGSYLVLSVRDDGEGLGAFNPYKSSTGLGTELCAAVAKAHVNGLRKGKVELYNHPQGGACFELWLP